MNSQDEKSRHGKPLNIFKGILGTITLGAIGSGIWDRLLSDSTESIIGVLVSFFSFFSESYMDFLYRDVGDILKEIFSMPQYTISKSIFLFSPILLIFLVLRNKRRRQIAQTGSQDENKSLISKILNSLPSTKVDYFWIVFSIFSLLLFISSTIKDFNTYNSALYIEKSIEVLAPHISNQDVLLLRAEFRMIDNFEKFKEMDLKLKSIAKDAKISLPTNEGL